MLGLVDSNVRQGRTLRRGLSVDHCMNSKVDTDKIGAKNWTSNVCSSKYRKTPSQFRYFEEHTLLVQFLAPILSVSTLEFIQ
jgi:hypothetical protein